MQFYLTEANKLTSKLEMVEAIASGADPASFVPVELPWQNVEWNRKGGHAQNSRSSPYPLGRKKTTIRVPKEIAYEVQQYASWLSKNHG